MKNFINKFSLTKTIRMELKPENIHAKNLKEDYELGKKNAINRAQDFSKLYVPVKKLMDDYYRSSINKVLKDFEITENEINILFDSYIKYKNDKNDKNWHKNTLSFRKIVVSALKELSSESSGTILENTKKSQSKISNYLRDQLEAGLITKNEFDENIKCVELFKGFVGFFDGYMQNRKNMFSDKPENTAIANRIVDNLTIYFENYIKIEKIKQISLELYEVISKKLNSFRALSDYSKLITQNSINQYNDIVGHKSEDKFAKGINQIINEYKQENPDQRKNIGYLNKLHNQILFRDVESSVPNNDFYTDEEVLTSLQSFIDNAVENYFNNAEKIFENPDNLFTDGIFILPNKINKLSEILFDGKNESYCILKQKFLEKEIDISSPFSLKTVNDLESGLNIIEGLNSYLKKLLEAADFSITEASVLIKELLNGTKAFDKDRRVPKDEKDLGGKGFQQIAIIQNAYMNLIGLNRFFALFKLEKDGELVAIEGIDEDFYGNLKNLTDFNEDLYLFTKVKNYLSKKPYSNDKIRIYFDNNAKLLSGFTESHTENTYNGTQYGGYLFRKKNINNEYDYFLGCSTNPRLFREHLSGLITEDDKSEFERLYYYQPKLQTIYNGYKSKEGNDYGSDKTKFKELIRLVAKRNGTTIIMDEKDTPTLLLSKIEAANQDLFQKICKDKDIINFQKEIILNLKIVFQRYVKKIPSLQSILEKEYSTLKDFIDAVSYIDNEKSFYYAPVSKKEMDLQNEKHTDENDKKLYLFKIQNKDLKQREDGKKSKGIENLHTMYFKALMSANQNCIDIGTGQVYFREKSYIGKEVIHTANNPIKNKTPNYPKENSTFSYDIRKDNRYFENKFFLHLSLFINYASSNVNSKSFNIEVNKYLYVNKDSVNIMGIDRGERNLLYVSIINQKGEILFQRSLNEISYSIKTNSKELEVYKNYHTLLENKAKERDLARKNWGRIDNIKELKEGYLSQVVHELTLLMVRYNAIIVLEDLNPKFKQFRSCIDTQLYQKFEKALIDKLCYMVFKKDEIVEGKVIKGGNILNGMQLATPITSFKDMKNQNGFIFYVWPQYTSKIDPVSGFVSLFDTRDKTISEHIAFFKKFKEISFENGDYYFVIDDYSKFYDKKNSMPKNNFVISSKGERIINKKNGRIWKSERIKPSEKLKELFEEYKVNLSKEILPQITETRLPLGFYNRLIKIFRSIVQLRNSVTGNGEVDYILSPIVDENGNNTFDSRIELKKEKSAKLPVDADANGAYHIALKGLMALKSITSEGTIRISASNADWFKFVQEKEYLK